MAAVCLNKVVCSPLHLNAIFSYFIKAVFSCVKNLVCWFSALLQRRVFDKARARHTVNTSRGLLFPLINGPFIPFLPNAFPLQVQLYEDFAKSQVKMGLDESVSHFDDEDSGKTQSRETPHIFQVGSHQVMF